VLDGLPNVPLTPEENSVGTGRSSESKSVEGDSLTTSGSDSCSGSVGESESGNGKLGDFGQSLVVENGTDSDDGLVTGRVGVLGLLDNSGEGDGGSVDLNVSDSLRRETWIRAHLAHKESPEDDSVESGLGPSGEESVELIISVCSRFGCSRVPMSRPMSDIPAYNAPPLMATPAPWRASPATSQSI
jgi:hypothetical protein